MKKWTLRCAAIFLLFVPILAWAQSSPGLTYGQVPTAGQWNSYFAAKQDVLGYIPVNRAGDTMTGKLKMTASTLNGAGINLIPGVAPTSPNNGDVWTTSAGIFVRINGATIGPIQAGIVGPPSSINGDITLFSGTSGQVLQDSGKTLPVGAVVGTTDTQTLTNKSISADQINSNTLPTAQLPALTGDITSSAGSNVTTLKTTVVIPSAATATTQSNGDNSTKLATTAFVQNAGVTWPLGSLWGMTLSYTSTTTITVSAGQARNQDASGPFNMIQAGALVKSLNAAWTAGTAGGCLDVGSTIPASGTRHVYAIRKDSDASIDELCSASATTPTMPTGYTAYRRIGSLTFVSSAIVQFTQIGDDFWFFNPAQSVNTTTLSTTRTSFTTNVPTGFPFKLLMIVGINSGTVGTTINIASPDDADQDPSTIITARTVSTNTNYSQIQVRTNTSAQISARASLASTTLVGNVLYWTDTRGRLN